MSIRFLFAFLFVIFLTGCAYQGIPPQVMQPLPATYQNLSLNPYLAKKISVERAVFSREVEGFHLFEKDKKDKNVNSDNFKIALKNSLDQAGYYSENNPEYRLDAELLNVNIPFAIFNFKATSKIRYRLTDIKTGREVYNEVVTISNTAGFSESFRNDKIAGIVFIRSIRENVTHFIKVLSLKNKSDLS